MWSQFPAEIVRLRAVAAGEVVRIALTFRENHVRVYYHRMMEQAIIPAVGVAGSGARDSCVGAFQQSRLEGWPSSSLLLCSNRKHGIIRIVKRSLYINATVATFIAALLDSLLIFGLAGMLAVLGFVEWERSRACVPLDVQLRNPRYTFLLAGSLSIFVISAFIQSLIARPQTPMWFVISLGALTVLSLTSTFSAWRSFDSALAGHDS